AWGDLEGTGAWTFRQDGPWAHAQFDWRFRLNKAVVKYGTGVLKPLFERDHRWAMAKGEESLRLEIDRRHTRPEDVHLLPTPPGTTKVPSRAIWAGIVLLGLFALRGSGQRRKG